MANYEFEDFSPEFLSHINELLETEEVQGLDNFTQHINTSRLKHSLNVSYLSYKICKKFGYDHVSAARAGLLHDLFLYDWRVNKQPEGNHAKAHPRVALRNAKQLAELNKIEEDAIVKHMWPLTIRIPRYKESFVVTFADKICCMAEVIDSLKNSNKQVSKESAI